MSKPLYQLTALGKSYQAGEDELSIFRDLNLVIPEGDSLAIVGASGSGKSTLLHLMGALDRPDSGSIFFDGRDMAGMDAEEQAAFRNSSIGFVFQFHHLLPEFSALENIAMPGLIAGMEREEALAGAEALLARVGLSARAQSRPSALSGGERQRVAIARALMRRPRALLADEPTGNLDEASGAQIGELLGELNRELGMTLILVTHNLDLAARMKHGLELRSGALYEKNFA